MMIATRLYVILYLRVLQNVT